MTTNDNLDNKLNQFFEGKVVRKDILHEVKKGTNIPTFVLEFLLARYCASDDPDEINEGKAAVLETLEKNYVRPDEANAAQSKVVTNGSHRFIDKIDVRFVEKDNRHWATLQNFQSSRVGINQTFYKENERLLEGGIWSEITIRHNPVEDDDYRFYVEELQPIQLSRFDFDKYCISRREFTRDEWLDVIMRSVGLEPSTFDKRIKFHYLARLSALVEKNYNYIELGPRGTGKSYFFSEFSPYATLISGGQATKAIMFYNNQRRKPGLVSFWDTVAFDEIGGIKIKDPDTVQIMKDFMANGRFSRGSEIIADASLSFVGNFDYNIDQVVNSHDHDLFQPLPEQLDLAIMDRFAAYIPGWEIPKTSSKMLTNNFGLITDYIAEAFHFQFKKTNTFDQASSMMKLGSHIEGRDEKAIKKTVSAFLKILHPGCNPKKEEFNEYLAYAIETRRRVKEQMNKRKPDDEFKNINLSYFKDDGSEVTIYCNESKNAEATQNPNKQKLSIEKKVDLTAKTQAEVEIQVETIKKEDELKNKNISIPHGATGFSYENIMFEYIKGSKNIILKDPYIRKKYQVSNFIRFCEMLVSSDSVEKVTLITSYDNHHSKEEVLLDLNDLKQSLIEVGVSLEIKYDTKLHDREIRIDDKWRIILGYGLDFYLPPENYNTIGNYDLSLRKCKQTNIEILKI